METPINLWIKSPKDGAVSEIEKSAKKNRGLQIWLHVNQAGDLVGFSSLGESNWWWPTPSDPRVPVSVVPYVAIQKQYQGRPDSPPKYSHQIIQHLVFEASQHTHRQPILGLYVDAHNNAALKLYEREGFGVWEPYTNPADGITYQGRLLLLEDYKPVVISGGMRR